MRDDGAPPASSPSPRFSVVLPTFNAAAYLEPTLRSVLDQDYPELEFIVVDGGSTDGTVDIIRRYADRLAYWVSEPDRGQCDAINKGFARATGELHYWANADDPLEPGALRYVASRLSDPIRPQWLVGAATLIDRRGRRIGRRTPTRVDETTFLLWVLRWIPTQAVFWNRAMWDAAGPFDEDLHYVMDLALWHRMHRTAPAIVTERKLGLYRLHDQSKTLSAFETSRRERKAHLASMIAADMARAAENGEHARRALAESYAFLLDELSDRGALLERMRSSRTFGPLVRTYLRLVRWAPELEK
jgi:hypothetical protein